MTEWIMGVVITLLLVVVYRLARKAFAAIEGENVRLRLENADLLGRVGALTESVVRIQRVSIGMPEQPRVAAPKRELPPPAIQREVMAIGDPRIRQMAMKGAVERFQAEGGWDRLDQELTKPKPGEADGQT